jgi:hypothetical protein
MSKATASRSVQVTLQLQRVIYSPNNESTSKSRQYLNRVLSLPAPLDDIRNIELQFRTNVQCGQRWWLQSK